MKIVRWMFSNLFLILLIVAVIYSYMFWGNLAGNDTPVGKAVAYLSQEFVEVEEFIHAIEEKQSQLAERQAASSPAVAGTATQKTTTQVLQANKEAAVNVNKGDDEDAVALNNNQQLPVSVSYSQRQTQVKKNSDTAIETKAVKTTSMPAAYDAVHSTAVSEPGVSVSISTAETDVSETKNEVVADTFVSAELQSQLNNVSNQGEMIDAPSSDGDVRAVWIKARQSFYQRNYALSEQSYQKVIENTQDNFDAYGELGNVYFNQGKNEEAASAYFEAAAIMIRKGQARRAKSLVGLLRHLDKSKAEELQQLIASVSS